VGVPAAEPEGDRGGARRAFQQPHRSLSLSHTLALKPLANRNRVGIEEENAMGRKGADEWRKRRGRS